MRLCDLGSASTKQYQPTQDWSMNQRSVLEDELAKYSTPMYRAPEMLDTWSNFPVNQVGEQQQNSKTVNQETFRPLISGLLAWSCMQSASTNIHLMTVTNWPSSMETTRFLPRTPSTGCITV